MSHERNYKFEKVHGIFFLSYFMVQTAAIQIPPQTVNPLFNSSLIIESTTGDASILGKTLVCTFSRSIEIMIYSSKTFE